MTINTPHISRLNEISRRTFMTRASATAFLGAGAPLALQLAAAGEAAAFDSGDYKAIVCVFLNGGNDHMNTVIPYDIANYDRYHAVRNGGAGRTAGGIAYGRDQLIATSLTPRVPQSLTDGLVYALNPYMPKMARLFNTGKAAIQLNVGPLMTPLTLAQYNSPDRTRYPLPPKLFSHNDQQSVWQSLGSEGSTIGWGGRMGDLALSSNSQSMLTCISASGNAVFVSGENAIQYQIGTDGAVPIWTAGGWAFGSEEISRTLKQLITQPYGHVLENEFSRVTKRSMELETFVNGALGKVSVATNFLPDGQPNPVASQMSIVAKLIAARAHTGAKRQVFFVSLGGFDSHDGLMSNHPALLAQLDSAMNAFYAATVELGVANKVTTFTASDFGRTFASNGNGSDHGWGGHHFIMGGAVQGGRYYGTAPHVSIDTDDQVGQGRLLPSTAVDQMAATLGRWFGVSNSELPSVLPHIGRFADSNMGYFA